jgi:general secretion pathway protein A
LSYEQHFGLTAQPFSNAPDSKFFYESEHHAEAMTKIMNAAETMKGLVVMLGDIGTGKTLLARKVLEKLEEDDTYVESLLVIVHSEITAAWLLRRLAIQLGIDAPEETKEKLFPQLCNRLIELHEEGKKAVVLIDEANMLKTKEIFEEFRGLLNLEVPGQKLLTMILIGMPDLEQNIALDPPLQQRIAVKFRLKALDHDETVNYIKHRLKIAGSDKNIFSDMALEAVFAFSKGTPRVINNICDNALLEAYLMKKDTVDISIIDNVAADLGVKK